MSALHAVGRRDWEATFYNWASPPGKTEQEKCERAVTAIKQAVLASDRLSIRDVTTFPQGSFANRLNVREDSDVDVCILSKATFHYEMPAGSGWTLATVGAAPATYLYDEYKNDVEWALVAHFGRSNVKRGNKAFDINENTYRVDADVVACFEFRQYYRTPYGGYDFHSGTALLTDREGKLVTNFPRQQYEEGVAKNHRTNRRYKPGVRILKTLRNEMDQMGIVAAGPIPSFLIESAVWNVPDRHFGALTYTQMIKDVLRVIYYWTKNDQACAHMKEANGIKDLFGSHQSWTRQYLNTFTQAAWDYIHR